MSSSPCSSGSPPGSDHHRAPLVGRVRDRNRLLQAAHVVGGAVQRHAGIDLPGTGNQENDQQGEGADAHASPTSRRCLVALAFDTRDVNHPCHVSQHRSIEQRIRGLKDRARDGARKRRQQVRQHVTAVRRRGRDTAGLAPRQQSFFGLQGVRCGLLFPQRDEAHGRVEHTSKRTPMRVERKPAASVPERATGMTHDRRGRGQVMQDAVNHHGVKRHRPRQGGLRRPQSRYRRSVRLQRPSAVSAGAALRSGRER